MNCERNCVHGLFSTAPPVACLSGADASPLPPSPRTIRAKPLCPCVEGRFSAYLNSGSSLSSPAYLLFPSGRGSSPDCGAATARRWTRSRPRYGRGGPGAGPPETTASGLKWQQLISWLSLLHLDSVAWKYRHIACMLPSWHLGKVAWVRNICGLIPFSWKCL